MVPRFYKAIKTIAYQRRRLNYVFGKGGHYYDLEGMVKYSCFGDICVSIKVIGFCLCLVEALNFT